MKRLLTAALALSLLGGTAAIAQPDHHDDHGYSQGHDNHGNDRSREAYQHQAQHNWARGERLPATYYHDHTHYVDYRSHHLRQPPHGYQWVQADNNYALVALATGVIASLVVANH